MDGYYTDYGFMGSDDSLENYWFTPMYGSDVWAIRRLLKGRTLL